ncbi:MAG: hypothetical protein Q9212_004727 [Teloschistes hypoglaucus]
MRVSLTSGLSCLLLAASFLAVTNTRAVNISNEVPATSKMDPPNSPPEQYDEGTRSKEVTQTSTSTQCRGFVPDSPVPQGPQPPLPRFRPLDAASPSWPEDRDRDPLVKCHLHLPTATALHAIFHSEKNGDLRCLYVAMAVNLRRVLVSFGGEEWLVWWLGHRIWEANASCLLLRVIAARLKPNSEEHATRSASMAMASGSAGSAGSAFVRFWLTDRARDTFLSSIAKEDLPSFRLACHDFGVRAAPLLFEHVTINFRASSFTKPARMAALDRIGHTIKALQFSMPHTSETFLPPLLDPVTGEEVNFIYEPYVPSINDSASRLSNPTYGSWEMTDLLVKQYSPLFHAAANIPSFVRAFSALTNLQRLQISCPGQEAGQRYRRSIVDYALISIRIAVERSNLQFLDTLSLASIHPGAVLYLNPMMGFGARPNSLKRWKRITNLTICMDSIPFIPYPPTDHLKLLHSYLHVFASSLTNFVFRWKGAKGLSPLSLDKEVCLQEKSPAMACPRRCHLALRPLKFERLTTMEVENIVVDASQVSSFITAHRRSISDFNFEDTHLRSGTWDQALAPLTRISGSDKWKEKAEEVMDVPLLLSPTGIEESKAINRGLAAGGGEEQGVVLGYARTYEEVLENFNFKLALYRFYSYPSSPNLRYKIHHVLEIRSLQSDDAGRKDAVKQANAIFAFKLKNKEGQEEAWNIDLKEKGAVTKGEAPEGKKANGESCPFTLSLSDEDFGKMVAGKTQAQKLFMSGKLKIKGDVMKATKMEPVLKKAQIKAKFVLKYNQSDDHRVYTTTSKGRDPMAKRSADTERLGEGEDFGASNDVPVQRATAAQLAARK